MSLWAFVCSVHLCFSVRKRTHPRYEIRPMRLAAEFVLSQRTFFSLTELTDLTEPFCALFRSHRTPPAYRIHRTLLPMKIPIRRQKAAYIQPIGVSRWSLPFPSGEGSGEGPLSFWHLSPFVIMSFCLKKQTCLHLSLCHSVLKKHTCLLLSLCHSV